MPSERSDARKAQQQQPTSQVQLDFEAGEIPPKTARRSRAPYNDAAHAFIYRTVAQHIPDLAEEFNLARGTVYDLCKKDGWREARLARQQHLQRKQQGMVSDGLTAEVRWTRNVVNAIEEERKRQLQDLGKLLELRESLLDEAHSLGVSPLTSKMLEAYEKVTRIIENAIGKVEYDRQARKLADLSIAKNAKGGASESDPDSESAGGNSRKSLGLRQLVSSDAL